MSELQDTIMDKFDNLKDFIEDFIEDFPERLKDYYEDTFTLPRQFLIFESIIFISLLLIFYKWNPYQIQSKNPLIVIQVLLIVFFFMMTSFLFVKRRSELYDTSEITLKLFLMKTASTFFVAMSLITIVMFIVWIARNFKSANTAITILSNLVIILGALGLLYQIFRDKDSSKINTKGGILGRIKKLILSIISFFIDIVESTKKELNITTSTTIFLLVVEIILISIHFLSPYIMRKIITHDGKILLNEPIYLENKTVLGTHETLYGKNEEFSEDGGFKHYYHYALSGWFTINPQPPNTRAAYSNYTDILNYGNKPRVQFNSAKNILRVQVQTDDNTIVDVYSAEGVVLFQRWNHIVINYDGGNMDVFLNGVLVGSKPNIAPYMEYDNVIVGADNGIEGGVCNIVYYNRNLTQSEISMEYRLLEGKSLPII